MLYTETRIYLVCADQIFFNNYRIKLAMDNEGRDLNLPATVGFPSLAICSEGTLEIDCSGYGIWNLVASDIFGDSMIRNGIADTPTEKRYPYMLFAGQYQLWKVLYT